MKKTRAKRDTTLRTETLSIRLSPRLRYLARIAAQKQLRPISSFIEWAVEHALASVVIGKAGETLADHSTHLWDVDERDRFVSLAMSFPELLNDVEQIVWKMLKIHRARYWRFPSGDKNQLILEIGNDLRTHGWINMEALREDWPLLLAIARGEQPESALHFSDTPAVDTPLSPATAPHPGNRRQGKE